MTIKETLFTVNKERKSTLGEVFILNEDYEIIFDDNENYDQEIHTIIARSLILGDSRGIYIPRDFATDFTGWTGITEENKSDLSDPENEFYWEAWENVLNNAFIVIDNEKWSLVQEGDLCAEAVLTLKEDK